MTLRLWIKLARHGLKARLLRWIALIWLHLMTEGPFIDLKVGRRRVRAARIAVVRVNVVVLDDTLDVDVVDIAVLTVRILAAFGVLFLLIGGDLWRVWHTLRVLHLLLVHELLVVGLRQHALVENLRILQLVLQEHLVDLRRVKLRDYNILIILWLRLGNLILASFRQHF